MRHSSPISRWLPGILARRRGASRDRCREYPLPRPGISAGLMQGREEPGRSGSYTARHGSCWQAPGWLKIHHKDNRFSCVICLINGVLSGMEKKNALPALNTKSDIWADEIPELDRFLSPEP